MNEKGWKILFIVFSIMVVFGSGILTGNFIWGRNDYAAEQSDAELQRVNATLEYAQRGISSIIFGLDGIAERATKIQDRSDRIGYLATEIARVSTELSRIYGTIEKTAGSGSDDADQEDREP